ncbi:MAG: hypothetical protein HZC36_03710 [Armatimonadetes bacterium]|nr:hypothetical protein [Armatimonadota bacterium]
MVVFITLDEGAGHTLNFLNRYGRKWSRHLTELTYCQLASRAVAPPGVYIFCDRERMLEAERTLACQLWDQLSTSPQTHRLLNNPHKQLTRFELLRALWRQETNDFNVYRVWENRRKVRYPVFVRIENDHSGPKSSLISSPDALAKVLQHMKAAGVPEELALIVEYQEVRSPDGLYRKYGAYRIGGRIFGQHVLIGEYWSLKAQDRIRNEATQAENSAYYRDNPHRELLMPYFELAHIEYGRIDYGFNGDRIQIWEINDNPAFATPIPSRMSPESKEVTYVEALDALAEGLTSGPALELFA